MFSRTLSARVFQRLRASIHCRHASSDPTLTRGPSPGHGRSAWVRYDGPVVYTVAYPFGYNPEDTAGDQTRKALACLDERLAQAGTDKRHILEATVFLNDMSTFQEMDAAWQEWMPEGCGASRATVGADLGGEVLVEMKVTAAAPVASQ